MMSSPKSLLIWKSMVFMVMAIPSRWKRLIYHFLQWAPYFRKRHLPSTSLLEWMGDLFFYAMDVIFVPDIIEIVMSLVKSRLRLLSDAEKEEVRKYFGSAVVLENIRINDDLTAKFNEYAHAFVSFHTINYHKKISHEVFIHEVVHIWQYQQFGMVYIFRALKAQNSKEGYDYGGLEGLYNGMVKSKKFISFNFEQQGEIFEDYCRYVRRGNMMLNPLSQACFEYYINQVKDGMVNN